MAFLLPQTSFFLAIFLLLLMLSMSKASLDVHYYYQTCPQAEKIISETVYHASMNDPKVSARILRMFFHDCFIRVRINFVSYLFNLNLFIFYVCCFILNGWVRSQLITLLTGMWCFGLAGLNSREPSGERWSSKYFSCSILCDWECEN